MEFALKAKYEAWVSDKWKDGNGKEIKNWQTKIKNTIPYLRPIFTNEITQDTSGGYHAGKPDYSSMKPL